ncbi:hypothetical protein BDN67DRAFT_912478, partial [Paxillus ammoniavirescens]
FNHLHFTLHNKIQINSPFIIYRCMAILSRVKPVMYDCCLKSCIAYTRKYVHHQYCPFYKEPHLKANGKPCRQFMYFPLIPHLQGYFQSLEMIKEMSYHALYCQQPGKIPDVFDHQGIPSS